MFSGVLLAEKTEGLRIGSLLQYILRNIQFLEECGPGQEAKACNKSGEYQNDHEISHDITG